MKIRSSFFLSLAVGMVGLVLTGCGGGAGGDDGEAAIRVNGSDTMVNLAQAWAEEFRKKHPDIVIEVGGGGSGVGITSLIDGTCTMANSSRRMKDSEIAKVKEKWGKEPKEHIVGHDALAIYVNLKNPLETISIPELAEIYGEEGTVTDWSQLGTGSGEIIRVSRQNSSGTYAYFREVVLGEKRNFKQGAISQGGSKDLVALVSRTPTAIGYSGMGYATDAIKLLKVAKKKGGPGVAPTVENAQNGTYPITRPLIIYTIGEESGPTKQFLDWIHGPEGQKVVARLGFVPLTEAEK